LDLGLFVIEHLEDIWQDVLEPDLQRGSSCNHEQHLEGTPSRLWEEASSNEGTYPMDQDDGTVFIVLRDLKVRLLTFSLRHNEFKLGAARNQDAVVLQDIILSQLLEDDPLDWLEEHFLDISGRQLTVKASSPYRRHKLSKQRDFHV